MTHLISGINVNSDGSVAIEYVTPKRDIRANGVIANHALLIPPTPEFDEDIAALIDAAASLLDKAIATTDSPLTAYEVDDSDDVSPYDNPLERPDVPS